MTSQEHVKTRLGSLLVEKKLITKVQLDKAILCQRLSDKPLGEILVDQKLVSTRQIKKALKIQNSLRSMVLSSVLSFVPLVLVGCGGGGGGSSSASSSDVIQEQPEVERSAQLSWSLPSERADGSDLELYEIDTFYIYHTTEDGSVEERLEVNGDETTLNIDNLEGGKHLFTVTAVDINGLESDFSDIVTKTIL